MERLISKTSATGPLTTLSGLTRTDWLGEVNYWYGVDFWGSKVIGPFFIPGNLNADMYLNMLSDLILPSVMSADDTFPSFFQQDGAPPHYGLGVCTYLDEQFPGRWIGRRGPTDWPGRSPDLSP